MSFKFEQLDVWNMSLDYSDSIYALAEKLPESERFNLKSQITRAATSVSLNIAEGSTGQSDPEQSRFLGMAIRSLIETVACQRLITRRKYVNEKAFMERLDLQAQELAKRLHAFRKSLAKSNRTISEEQYLYDTGNF
jgi:four helix bundle protein